MKKVYKVDCCDDTSEECCKIEAIVSVDEKGQIVLPKEIRTKMGIKTNDKLAIIGWEQKNEAYCISLIKAEKLHKMVRVLLGPMMEQLTKDDK